MIKDNDTYSVADYVVIYLLIAVSGIPFFLFGATGIFCSIAIIFVLIIYLLLNSRLVISNRTMSFVGIYLLVFVLIFFIQSLECGFFPTLSFSKYLTQLLMAALALIVIGQNFFKLYIKTIYVLGIISLTIHVLTFIVPPFFDFLINVVVPHIPNQPDDSVQIFHNYHIIIHDFWQRDLFRNSGPFWEPGANAGFTLIALLFNVYVFNQKLSTKVNLLFICVILSTLSTAGYVVLTLILFLNPQYNKNFMLRIFSVIFFFIIASWAFATFDFIGVKVLQQIDNTDVGDAHSSRFASARLDYETFLRHPLGFSMRDYRKGVKADDDFRTNGVFIFLTAAGVIAFFSYFILVYIGMKKTVKFFNPSGNAALISIYFIIILLFLGFSENFFERPLFMAFSMLIPYFNTLKAKRHYVAQVFELNLAEN